MFVILRKAIVAIFLLSCFNCLSFRNLFALWTAIVFVLVALGYLTNSLTGLPGKNPKTGDIPFFRVLVFLPYYLVVVVIMTVSYATSRFSKRASRNRVTGDVYVGDYYSSFEKGQRWAAIVDVTNELPRLGVTERYLNIPSWDGTPPSASEIQLAVQFIKDSRGPVLVHCAHGKGRSVTVVVAYLKATKICDSIEDGIKMVWVSYIFAFDSLVVEVPAPTIECQCLDASRVEGMGKDKHVVRLSLFHQSIYPVYLQFEIC